MQRTPRLLTVNDVMQIIPMSKPAVTKIVSSIPHVKAGKRLLVAEEEVTRWILSHTHEPSEPKRRPKPITRCNDDDEFPLTEDGFLPTRKQMLEIEAKRQKKARKAKC